MPPFLLFINIGNSAQQIRLHQGISCKFAVQPQSKKKYRIWFSCTLCSLNYRSGEWSNTVIELYLLFWCKVSVWDLFCWLGSDPYLQYADKWLCSSHKNTSQTLTDKQRSKRTLRGLSIDKLNHLIELAPAVCPSRSKENKPKQSDRHMGRINEKVACVTGDINPPPGSFE